jgi:hypothetical protein
MSMRSIARCVHMSMNPVCDGPYLGPCQDWTGKGAGFVIVLIRLCMMGTMDAVQATCSRCDPRDYHYVMLITKLASCHLRVHSLLSSAPLPLRPTSPSQTHSCTSLFPFNPPLHPHTLHATRTSLIQGYKGKRSVTDSAGENSHTSGPDGNLGNPVEEL